MLVSQHSNGALGGGPEFANEREILYKLFFDLKKDVTELKKMFLEMLQHDTTPIQMPAAGFFKDVIPSGENTLNFQPTAINPTPVQPVLLSKTDIQEPIAVDESLNIMDMEKELIIKALNKHKGKRKDAAVDLGISERTLYRKLKEYDIEDL
jgi:DNA-binding NtrC family response regulator